MTCMILTYAIEQKWSLQICLKVMKSTLNDLLVWMEILLGILLMWATLIV